MRTIPPLPINVVNNLAKLGRDIRSARIKRRIKTATMAERAYISRPTLCKVEKGDPSVSMGVYANVLYALGVVDHIGKLVDARVDEVGLELVEKALPNRIRN